MSYPPHARRLPVGRTLCIALLVLFGWVGVAQAGQVCFYNKSYYRKASHCVDFEPGGAPQFGSKEYKTLRAPNNEIGSVKITGDGFPGMWMYDGLFDHKSRLITGDTPDLGNMNNEMSSWVIRNTGSSNTKVRIFVRKVFYDGKDPDGRAKPDHLLFARVWRGDDIVWHPLIVGSRLNGPRTWSGHVGANYKRDKNYWIPAVVHDWDFEIGQDRQITLASWDCAGTCYPALTPDQWQQTPPCATGRCTQQAGGTVYPLGDLVLDLTKHRAGETVTLSNGTVTVEVEIWKNPYHGEGRRDRRDRRQLQIVGGSRSYTAGAFRDYVSGMRFTASPNAEPAYALVGGEQASVLEAGECTVSYPNARQRGGKANVRVGALVCMVPLSDGVTASVTPVFGGCDGSEADCEIGVFGEALQFEHSRPGCGGQNCLISGGLTVRGPSATACDSVSFDNYCQPAEPNGAVAEVTVKDAAGNGVGVGIGAPVGVGAAETVDERALQTDAETRLQAGAEIAYAFGHDQNARAVYRIGERGVMFLAHDRKAMGKRAADAYRAVHGKTGIKAFGGRARIRHDGNALRYATDVFGAASGVDAASGQGSWKDANTFFDPAESWNPRY